MTHKHDIINKLISRLQQEENFPAISQHITEISSRASPSSESSANQLAALILRDYSLTSRLLKVSNSAMYGQFSGRISSISRAVVVLGFEQVQLTAAGLIFFEHLQDRLSSHYVKEAVLSAFLSGILARDLAKMLRFDGWENFYIGAMFHNFGRLLCMNYFSEEYKTYRQLIQEGLSEAEASRKGLGVTFADLGEGVARYWCLPDQIVVSMKLPDQEELNGKCKKINHQQWIPLFANELCDITMNVAPETRRQQLANVLTKYRKLYPVRVNEIVNLMDAAIKEMKKFSDVLRFDREDMERLEKRTFDADERLSPSINVDSQAHAALRLNKFTISSGETTSGRLRTAEERRQHLQDGIQNITNVMLDDFALDEILGMIVETIYSGIDFARVVIFFKDPQSGQMQARYGLGPNSKHIIKELKFSSDETAQDLFNMAINENKDLYIENISDVEIRDYKPDWFEGAIFSPSFVVLPIVINHKGIGLIYAGHDEPGKQLDHTQLNAIKTLRNQAALAIKQASRAS